MKIIFAFAFLIIIASDSCKRREGCDCPAFGDLDENSSPKDSLYYEMCLEDQLNNVDESSD